MGRVELPSHVVTCYFKNVSRLLHVDFVLVGVSMLGGRKLVTIMPVTRGSTRQSSSPRERGEGK